jgi:hypothetical protein
MGDDVEPVHDWERGYEFVHTAVFEIANVEWFFAYLSTKSSPNSNSHSQNYWVGNVFVPFTFLGHMYM